MIGTTPIAAVHARPKERSLARAKRINRADARRRYRAQLAETTEPDDGAESATVAAPRTPRRTQPAPPTAGPRRSMGQAFREAFRPLDLRGDLKAYPSLLRTRAGWLPPLLVIGAAVVTLGLGTTDMIGNLAFYWFIYPFPMAPAFVIGFFALRASWLLGIPVGILGAVAALVILSLTPGAATADSQALLAYAFTTAPPLTALFAAAAAWYKRFLALINPNRGRAPAGSAGKRVRGSRRSPAGQPARR
jgi:hypothetical protein